MCWFLPFENGGKTGGIAPLEHCDNEGNLDFSKCFLSDSYAHCYDGTVVRYGEVIGKLEDFISLEIKSQ